MASKARAVTSAKSSRDVGKEAAQDQTAETSAVSQAGLTLTSTIAADITPDQLRGMSPALRRKRLAGLSLAGRSSLVSALQQDPEILDDLFAATPDTEVSLLKTILSERFHKSLVGADHTQWQAGGLRHLYAVLAGLPPEHVGGNASLKDFVRYEDSDQREVHGVYSARQVEISYDEKNLNRLVPAEYNGPTDGLAIANEFDAAALHEVGHAVDEKFGYTDAHMSETMFGGWKRYPTARAWVTEIFDQSADAATSADMRKTLIDTISMAVLSETGDENGAVDRNAVTSRFAASVIAKLGIGPPSPDDAIAIGASDTVIRQIGSVLCEAKPWNGSDGGGALGGRVYEESYNGQFMSYDVSTRDPAKRCSLYQFRAPGEFFAESYTLYYTPVKSGQVRGALLADRNKPLFDWMQKNFEKPDKPATTAAPTTPANR